MPRAAVEGMPSDLSAGISRRDVLPFGPFSSPSFSRAPRRGGTRRPTRRSSRPPRGHQRPIAPLPPRARQARRAGPAPEPRPRRTTRRRARGRRDKRPPWPPGRPSPRGARGGLRDEGDARYRGCYGNVPSAALALPPPGPLRTARRATAVRAAIAAPVAHHDAAAVVARRGVHLRLEASGGWGGRGLRRRREGGRSGL